MFKVGASSRDVLDLEGFEALCEGLGEEVEFGKGSRNSRIGSENWGEILGPVVEFG